MAHGPAAVTAQSDHLVASGTADWALTETASRSQDRQAASQSTKVVETRPVLPDAFRSSAEAAADQSAQQSAKQAADQAAKQAADAKAAAEAKAAADLEKALEPPVPVAGLTQVQMNNAKCIVEAGKAMGLPEAAYVAAVACSMQESHLYNLASSELPESYSYPNEGSPAPTTTRSDSSSSGRVRAGVR